MPHTVALVLTGYSPVRFAGLDVTERAALVASRAGASHVHISGAAPVDEAIVGRLRSRGLVVTFGKRSARPFEDVPSADLLLVLPVFTIVEPAALRLLCRRWAGSGKPALALDCRPVLGTDIVAMSGDALERVRGAACIPEALRRLAAAGRLGTITVAPYYCARLSDQRDVARVERAYLRHTNGGDGEGLFTRNIRAFSIPVSRLLLRLPITANHVTLVGFALSLNAGAAFSRGTYAAGLVGALFYWASMVLDCSDGEVARARLGDSRFGAWLETVTDYISYFAVLGGILWGDRLDVDFARHVVAAAIGGGATLAIMTIVGYLRARIAHANPGALDDALAAQLQRGTRFQRFTGWGRQLIKRSFLAHLILFQALIGHLPALAEIWACGALGALLVLLGVQAHLIRSVRVEPLRPTVSP